MEKLKASQQWAVGETIVWFCFIVVNAITGLSQMQLINMSHGPKIWLGRLTVAFSLLALLYVTYLASKQRTK